MGHYISIVTAANQGGRLNKTRATLQGVSEVSFFLRKKEKHTTVRIR
jgi:hypothetical protein